MRFLAAALVFCASSVCLAQPQTHTFTSLEEAQKFAASLPKGKTGTIKIDEREETASGKGADLDATGDATKTAVDSSAPGVGLHNGTTATGGSAKASTSADVSGAPWYRILLLVAGVGFVGGAGWKATRVPPEIDTALGLLLSGVVLIVCGIYPVFLWLLIVAAVVLALPHFLPDKAKAELKDDLKAAEEKAKAIVKGIDVLRAHPSVGQQVQQAMKAAQADMKLAMGKEAAAFVAETKST